MSRSSKLKVHRAYSQTISSYPVRSVRLSMDIIFSSTVSVAFCFLVVVIVIVFLSCFEIKNIYSDTHSAIQSKK